MGVGPIPMSKLRSHVRDELELLDVDEEWAVGVIQRLDNEYLTLKNKDDKSKDKAAPIAATDTEGVRQMFTGLKARKAQEKTSRAKKPA